MSIQSVKIVVLRAHEDSAVSHSGTRNYYAACRVIPDVSTVSSPESVNLVVVGADVNDAVSHSGRTYLTASVKLPQRLIRSRSYRFRASRMRQVMTEHGPRIRRGFRK